MLIHTTIGSHTAAAAAAVTLFAKFYALTLTIFLFGKAQNFGAGKVRSDHRIKVSDFVENKLMCREV